MKNSSFLASFGILVLRLGFGVYMLLHGWGKIQGFEKLSADWFDPFNMGPKYSLIATIAAEVGCSALLILGFATRLSAVALAFTMGVAAFMFHANDPWITTGPDPSREPALLYGIVYLTLIFAGPGKLSMDHLWFGRKKPAAK
jgi:putative oxidoreductase